MRGGRFRTRLTRETKLRAAFERRADLPKSIELVTTVHPLVRLAATVRREAAQGISAEPVVSVAVPASASGVSPGTYVAAAEHWSVDGAVRVDRIAFGVRRVDGNAVDPLIAEQLVQSALRDGRHEVGRTSVETVLPAMNALRDATLTAEFETFVDEEEARHFDRAETGIARLERQHEKRVRDTEEKLWSWKMSGDARKLKLIPAEQGKLNKLLARLDLRREELSEARDRFSFQRDLVGLAIISVN